MRQIYEILRKYKYSTHVNHFLTIRWQFRHNHLNVWNMREDDKINPDLLLILFRIADQLPRTHFNEFKLDWIDKSMTIDLSYNSFGITIRKNNYYDAINAMVESSILFRLSKRGHYLVNPYILNVLSQQQASYIANCLTHDNAPESPTVSFLDE